MHFLIAGRNEGKLQPQFLLASDRRAKWGEFAQDIIVSHADDER